MNNMRKKFLKNMEWSVLICVILLVIIGLFAIYSATANANFVEFKKQVMWLGISLPFFIIATCVDYEYFVKYSPILYGISIITLIGVLFTEPISGATSWFNFKDKFSIQPSEFAKISLILFLSYVMAKMKEKGDKEISRPTRLMLLFAIFLVPLLLVIKQPDYGTATAYIAAFGFMLFMAGLDRKYIIAGILIVGISIPLMYQYVLPPHAKERLEVFMNPDLDPRGAGYNINQSMLAVGAGELTGMGFMKGNQTQLGYLYPKSTDFIFPVIAEELGFIVASLVIICYVILITKSVAIAKTSKDAARRVYRIGNSPEYYSSTWLKILE